MKLLLDIASVLSAFATVAVGWFAWIQLRREKAAAEVSTAAASARASGAAYLLRGELAAWVGASEDDFENWIRAQENARTLTASLDRAVGLARELLSEAGLLQAPSSAGAHYSFLLLVEGRRRLLEYSTTPRPDDGTIFDWLYLRRDSRRDLVLCIAALESTLIDQRLLDHELTLRAARADDDSLQKLSDHIVLESELSAEADRITAERASAPAPDESDRAR